MHKDAAATASFFETFRPLIGSSERYDVVICPPFLRLEAAVGVTRGTGILIDAQNLHWPEEGAYNGEVSGPMIRASGCLHRRIRKEERERRDRGTVSWQHGHAHDRAVCQGRNCLRTLLRDRFGRRGRAVDGGEAHQFIRGQARANFGEEASSRILILC